ncbi:hypothetical protein [Leeuwenhoekiella parthenopeia]|uniref:Uncharacterized protein n=1 Tax=Leeuwenhoekiella parthenopeia TaxID=2890320 RepID=A0ABS8GPP5_9FLAO|nr:hypothetical protein [Leeuwenhoekiella parthenopeia]MCC4211660.1 hypothetical protein [Leeuwenhoekiella parthenopeia]
MDLQTRKLEFIKEFLKIQSEEVLSRLEKALKKEHLEEQFDFLPFTEEEFNFRIDKSLEDSKNLKLTEAHTLLEQIKKWN